MEDLINGQINDDLKRLWNTEMDIAQKVLDVCQKHNLRIWAEGGTLLGAVRHKGFIPWDDDIDFVMMREDYEIFKKIGPSEFHHPYFFQSFDTDNYGGGIIKVRNSNTTMIDARHKKLRKKNYGVFVDIIVMDGVPSDEKEFANEVKEITKKWRFLTRYKEYLPDYSSPRAIIRQLLTNGYFFFHNPKSYRNSIVEILSKNKPSESEWCAKVELDARFYMSAEEIDKRKVSWYNETIQLPFQDMFLPAPKQYDKVLTSQFGKDYMTPIKESSWHTISIIDCNKSYTETLKSL